MRHEPSSGGYDASTNYKVTWRSVDEGGVTYERIFENLDHGWDFYQDQLKSANAYAVTWEHVPALS